MNKTPVSILIDLHNALNGVTLIRGTKRVRKRIVEAEGYDVKEVRRIITNMLREQKEDNYLLYVKPKNEL